MGVSILMPFKNSENWIEEAILSIQQQTYTQWELIAVNDSSSDNCAEIIQRLGALDSRIRLFSNDGNGIIPALQTGFEKVQNELITRLDSDDTMPSDRLEKMVSAASKFGPGHLITGKVSYFSEDEVSDGYLSYANWLNDRVENGDFFEWRFRECVIASPAWMMYSQDLRKTGGFENLTYPEDYNLVLRWLYSGIQFQGIKDKVLNWREHPGRTSRNHEGFQQKAFFVLKLRFLLEKEYDENTAVLILTSSSPKTKLTLEFFENHHIPTQTFSIDTIADLPQNAGNLLLSAVYPKSQKRKQLEKYVENLGYRHGIDFFYL
jgi:glycosyltransferase involved in cell wall biosynthesis